MTSKESTALLRARLGGGLDGGVKQCAGEKWVGAIGLPAACVCVRRSKVGVRMRAKQC